MVRNFIAAVLLVLAGSPLATAGTLLLPFSYNVFVLGNFTETAGSDSQGALAAGGTVNIAHFSVASALPSNTTMYTLVGGTNVIASSGSVNGKVYDGTPGGIAGDFTIAPGNLSSTAPGPIDFSDAGAKINALSNGLKGTSQTAGDSCSPNYYYLTCTATQHGLNIINIPDTSYIGSNSHAPQIVSTYSDATIVLNIGGTNASLTSGGWSISGVSAQNILLNFYEATSLTYNGSVPVSVMAPHADVTGSGGAQNGSLIAYSFSGQYEFHNTLFTGSLPSFESSSSSMPEPMSLLLTGGGIVCLLLRRLRASAASPSGM
jgi:choice-of-anchor A domain-containing protein